MGIGFPAARRFDLTLHFPVIIITGSPDTDIGFLPAARLNDICSVCLLPPCKPPLGKIVTSSKTVFINRLGAARVLDFVNCGALGKPPGPPGCDHPAARRYEPRPADHYEEMIEIEHEASEWDEVEDYKRQELDGKRDKAASPVGIQGGGLSRPKKPPAPGGAAFPSGGGENPLGGGGGGSAGSIPSGGGAAMGGGSGVAGDRGGGKGKGPDKTGGSSEYEDEKKRDEPKKLDLSFPIDLRFGSRRGTAGYPPNKNVIMKGDFTVIVG